MRLALLCVVAACAPHLAPVQGAAAAAARHYPTTVAAAHDAAAKVLLGRYGALAVDDGRHLAANGACRTDVGGRCIWRAGDHVSAQSMAPPTFAEAAGSPIAGAMIQIVVGVVGEDGDVTIQVGGRGRIARGRDVQIGAPGAPAWMAHEADEVRVAIDAALR